MLSSAQRAATVKSPIGADPRPGPLMPLQVRTGLTLGLSLCVFFLPSSVRAGGGGGSNQLLGSNVHMPQLPHLWKAEQPAALPGCVGRGTHPRGWVTAQVVGKCQGGGRMTQGLFT